MIADSSAIIAIFFQEPNSDALVKKIAASREVGIGTPTVAECGIVLTARLGWDARGLLSRFLEEMNITTIPFTETHFVAAIGAWIKYGKGQHPAKLNFGDCLAYAVAKTSGLPLLCVGDDFPQTDRVMA